MDEFEDGLDHDDAHEQPAQSSIAAPLIRALLAAAVAFGIYALVFGDFSGDDDLDISGDLATAPTPTPVPLPTTTQAPATPLPTPTAPATPTGAPGTEQVGAGVTVQVIAGANTTREQFDAAAAALRDLGYDVTVSGISPNAYAQTTIFATPGEESLAEALVGVDPRFTTFDPEFPGLNEQIQLHVLVGEDWPTGAAADTAPTEG